MSNRFPLVAACAAVLLASGCGTVGNFNPGYREPGGPPSPKVFGGVREDVRSLQEVERPLWVLADLPFSLAGDVFTLPWTLRAARLRKAWPKESPAVLPEP
jgi:uncharacterized protein YceK